MNPYRWNCNKSFSHTHRRVCVCFSLCPLCCQHPAKASGEEYKRRSQERIRKECWESDIRYPTAGFDSSNILLVFFSRSQKKTPSKTKKRNKSCLTPPPSLAIILLSHRYIFTRQRASILSHTQREKYPLFRFIGKSSFLSFLQQPSRLGTVVTPLSRLWRHYRDSRLLLPKCSSSSSKVLLGKS
jgi:hypothetical protein